MAVKVKPYLFFLHFSIIMPYKDSEFWPAILRRKTLAFPSALRDQAVVKKEKNTPTIAAQPPTQKPSVIIP